MTVQLQVTQVIERPLADVFHFYAVEHVRNHPRWDPDIELSPITPGPIGVGTLIRRRNKRSGTPVDGTMEVVEFEPGRAFATLIHDGPVEMHGRATFEALAEDRTLLTVSAEIPGMDEAMDKSFLLSRMQRSVDTIKKLIEGVPPSPPFLQDGGERGGGIVFISRNRVKEGMLDDFIRHYQASIPPVESGKPGTLVQLAYFDPQTAELVIVRVFASPEAMDLHLQGADQRSKAAYLYIEPTGVEVYGAPNAYALEMLRKVAGTGVEVRLSPQNVGGFVRSAPVLKS
jgi:hypothetical protein